MESQGQAADRLLRRAQRGGQSLHPLPATASGSRPGAQDVRGRTAPVPGRHRALHGPGSEARADGRRTGPGRRPLRRPGLPPLHAQDRPGDHPAGSDPAGPGRLPRRGATGRAGTGAPAGHRARWRRVGRAAPPARPRPGPGGFPGEPVHRAGRPRLPRPADPGPAGPRRTVRGAARPLRRPGPRSLPPGGAAWLSAGTHAAPPGRRGQLRPPPRRPAGPGRDRRPDRTLGADVPEAVRLLTELAPGPLHAEAVVDPAAAGIDPTAHLQVQ